MIRNHRLLLEGEEHAKVVLRLVIEEEAEPLQREASDKALEIFKEIDQNIDKNVNSELQAKNCHNLGYLYLKVFKDYQKAEAHLFESKLCVEVLSMK